MREILLLICAISGPASAALTVDLVAYYDFEQSGAAGLENKAPGATGYDLSWGVSGTLSQTGFGGDATFTASDGTSDRGTLLAGNALNLVDLENAYLVSPIGSADLGDVFSISIWTYLAYGDSNGSNRFQALESADGNYDVSWGTTGTVNTTGYDDYLAYVETQATSTISGLAPFAWQYALLEYDLTGANPTVAVYLNGSTVPVIATDTSGTFAFSGLNIGRERIEGSGDRDWDGMIDEVAIWDRALTEAERTEVHARGIGGDPLIDTSDLLVLSLSSSNPAHGTVSGSGLYGSGTEVAVSAVAEP